MSCSFLRLQETHDPKIGYNRRVQAEKRGVNRQLVIFIVLIVLVMGTLIAGGVIFVRVSNHVLATISAIKISDSYAPEIFPKEWRDDSTLNPKAVRINPVEFLRFEKLIRKELSRYPEPVLRFRLQTIYGLKSLNFYGDDAPGGFSGDAIYIASAGEEEGYTDELISEAFHYQMAAMFYYNGYWDFDESKWESHLPKDFKYDLKADLSGYTPDDTGRNPKWLSRGFAHSYAVMDQESDFCIIASLLMTGNNGFYKQIKRHPRLRSKVEFVVDFYKRQGVKMPDYEALAEHNEKPS